MSDGLNDEFMKDPDRFLQKYPVDIFGYLNSEGKMNGPLNDLGRSVNDNLHIPKGVYDFDLSRDSTLLVQLRLFADRDKQSTRHSNRISGYWLPWESKKTSSVSFDVLDQSGAPFFFTSSLGGCRFLITEDGVHHIAGDLNKMKRENASEVLRGGGRARSFSSTSGNSYGDGAFICGYRAKTGFTRHRRGGWNFVAQSFDYEGDTLVVGNVWLNNDLFLIE